MPSNDTHPFAEERRLFYVALTRARRSVVLMTVENSLSEFIVELVNDKKVEVISIDGKPSKVQTCPVFGAQKYVASDSQTSIA